MKIQNQIKRALSKPEAVEYIGRLLEEREFSSRTELADFVCRQFGFQDPAGRKQRGGCLKALRELEGQGCFRLPPPRIQKGDPTPRRLGQPVAEPDGVPGEVGEVGGLELIRVGQESQMRIWNELMIREHPRGAGPLVGRQDRYSKHEETIKDIYVYRLEKDFRARLGLAAGAGLGPLGPADGLDGTNWAKQEFGGAPLGDARLSRRLVNIAPSEIPRAPMTLVQGDVRVKGRAS